MRSTLIVRMRTIKKVTPFLPESSLCCYIFGRSIRSTTPRQQLSSPLNDKIKQTDHKEKMASPKFCVDSPKVQFNARKNSLLATYDYQTTKITKTAEGKLRATPCTEYLTFKTDCKVPRVGCMLVGWGGNNGSTLTASVMANKMNLEWRTKEGVQVNMIQSLSVVGFEVVC